MSDYATQLREKQKARRIYGVFERQFRVYFQEASKSTGVTGAALMQFLERRFDNVIYRLGFATSRAQARQLVLHGHFAVNGKPINVPSYLLKPGDVVTVVEDSRKNAYFQSVAKDLSKRSVPGWLTLDPQNLSGTIVTLPAREQIDTQIKEQLIVEYYSR
jgi:small subunit ribosomal protein S4